MTDRIFISHDRSGEILAVYSSPIRALEDTDRVYIYENENDCYRQTLKIITNENLNEYLEKITR